MSFRCSACGGNCSDQVAQAASARLDVHVTSPGGTTEAALGVLMEDKDGLQQLMTRALDAATRRSRELAG